MLWITIPQNSFSMSYASRKVIFPGVETYRLAELDGAEFMSWIHGSQLKKIFTHNEGIHSASVFYMDSIQHEKVLEKFESFEVKVVAGKKYTEGRWMCLIQCKDREKWWWVWVEDKVVYKKLVEISSMEHPVQADHPSNPSCKWWARRGGKQGNRLHGLLSTELQVLRWLSRVQLIDGVSISTLPNWVDLQDGDEIDITIGWVAPSLH